MAELLYAELTGETLRAWQKIDLRLRDTLKFDLPYIAKIDGNKILFTIDGLDGENRQEIRAFEYRVFALIEKFNPSEKIRSLGIKYVEYKGTLTSAVARIEDFEDRFSALTFGSDVAEQDSNLLEYFIETPSYARVEKFQKGIVIGPKGSGKSSILKALAAGNTAGHSIVITPEVFATSMLQQIIEEGGQNWDEERAFSATWEFSILFEVFKQIHADGKGLPKSAQAELAKFLKTYSEFETGDLFSRFIRYLRKIQSVKIAGIEIAVKAKELQELYALEPVYNLVLKIRNYLRRNILILIDELDQGWDNSEHSNRFLAGLLQAAVQIQNLGIQAHVVVFVRSEIFDLVRSKLAQLDKIRSSIEKLKWSEGELMNLIAKRMAHNLKGIRSYEPKEIMHLFFEATGEAPGFDYLLSRTTRRPREVLQFTRLAHQNAAELKSSSFSTEAILKAEEEFSGWKLEHLCSEYLHVYPDIEKLLRSFRGKQKRLERSEIEYTILEIQDLKEISAPWILKSSREILEVLYQLEFIGVKRVTKSKQAIRELGEFEFAYEGGAPTLKVVEEFMIHPAFWKTLELLG